jgi:GTPase SAR1 family protein
MARQQVISSPYGFPERILAFGMEGSGKSSLIHNVLKHHTEAHGWIIDLDSSNYKIRTIAAAKLDLANNAGCPLN